MTNLDLQRLYKILIVTEELSQAYERLSKLDWAKSDFIQVAAWFGFVHRPRDRTVHDGCIWAESTGYDDDSYPGSTFYVVLSLHQ